MSRYVDEKRTLTRVRQILTEEGGEVPDSTVERVLEKVERYLGRQPVAPDLVSRKEAARILGVQSPNIARFAEQGRMPDPIDVEGSAPVYVRQDVEAFRDKRKADAEAARQRRERRESAAEERTRKREETPAREKEASPS